MIDEHEYRNELSLSVHLHAGRAPCPTLTCPKALLISGQQDTAKYETEAEQQGSSTPRISLVGMYDCELDLDNEKLMFAILRLSEGEDCERL